jgi:thimet oligopeptidase
MRLHYLLLMSLALSAVACSTPKSATGTTSLRKFEKPAPAFNSVVSLPKFETTPRQIKATVRKTIAVGNAALDRIGKQDLGQVNFDKTVRALDDMAAHYALAMNRLGLIKETSPSAELRDSATDAIKQLEEWAVGLDYREEVYRAIKTYADTRPGLIGENAKLLADVMRNYRRAGLDLPKPERDEVEKMRKELASLETDFESNINKAKAPVKFTRAELAGVPEDFLKQVKTGEDEYTVMANITWHWVSLLDNASREESRHKIYLAQNNLARAENIPLLEKILVLRDKIALKLGYTNWADFQTEVKMVKNYATAIKFLEDLKTGLQPKFDAEQEELRQLKVRQTGDTNAIINIWDWRYFANELRKTKYNVDAEQ